MDKEEGEMSDDAMLVDDPKDSDEEIDVKPVVLYKAEKNGLVVTQLEKIDAAKLEERAKRFGLNLTGNRIVTQKQIDELYYNFGIQSGNERHYRFDTLHLNGVDGLSTREIFGYLEDYKPVSLECIDDVACNVVCQDHISAALALLVHSREISNQNLKEMIGEKSSHHWREGVPHPKKDLILLRFATNGDKKMSRKKVERKIDGRHDVSMEPATKNPWGDLCKSWGVYDHQEVFNRRLPKTDYEDEIEDEPIKKVQIKNKQLAMRLGKRPVENNDNDESSSDDEWKKKSKTPRMRMHADDVESRQKKKKHVYEVANTKDKDAYAPLSIEVINSRSSSSCAPRETTILSEKFRSVDNSNQSRDKRLNIQSRLGAKVVAAANKSSSDEYSSDDSEHNTMSRVQKVSTTRGSNSVWSRLETKADNSSGDKDLRQILKSRKQNKADDLRDRIGNSKKTLLRIEIDNN